jgi:hypothetical protein
MDGSRNGYAEARENGEDVDLEGEVEASDPVTGRQLHPRFGTADPEQSASSCGHSFNY